MKFALAMIMLTVATVACTHNDSPSNPGLSVPSRVSQNKPAECPTGVEGTYRLSGVNVEGPDLIIRSRNGILILTNAKNEDLPVTGVPTAGPDGAMATAICVDGEISIDSNESTGHYLGTLAKNSDGSLHFDVIKNGQTESVDYQKIY
jgi:hypothetical protein